jgi:hypothetical protein
MRDLTESISISLMPMNTLKNEKSYERYGKSKIFSFLSLLQKWFIDRPPTRREHQIINGDFRGRKWYYAGYAIWKKLNVRNDLCKNT